MKKATYAVAIAIIIYGLLKHNPFVSIKDSNGIKTDTVTIIKYLPSKANEFVKTAPQPVYITKIKDNSKELLKLLKELENKYNKTADNNILLQELLQAKQKHTYKETFKDSVLNAEVTAYTTGVLDSIKFKYKTLPIEVKEIQITRYLTPRFRVFIGVNGVYGYDNLIGADLGIQTKKGNIYVLGINSNTDITFGFKFNVFEKY